MLLYGTVESGGLPADPKKIDDPCFPLETLPSPVIPDDINDAEFEETLKLSFENSISALLELNIFGFVKSSVRLVGAAGAVTGVVICCGVRVRFWKREKEGD